MHLILPRAPAAAYTHHTPAMPFELSVDQELGLARGTFSGAPRYEDVMGGLRQVLKDDGFVVPRRLWDLRGCQLFLTNDEIREIGEVAQAHDTSWGRTAVLVDRDVDFGQARVFHAYRESENNPVQVFRSEEEALAWLLADGP